MMRKCIKKLTSYILAVVLSFGMAIGFAGCGKKADSFTEEEHIQRITARLEKRVESYDDEKKEKYGKFEVYPLYNQKEELKYFLIEYEPYGFRIGRIQDEPSIFQYFSYAHQSMYILSSELHGEERPWTPYIRNENSPTLPSLIEGWSTERTGEVILDADGNMNIYYKSPYFVFGTTNAKRYLLETGVSNEFICAERREGGFVNLISGLEFAEAEAYNCKKHATLNATFYASNMFDL